MEQEQKPTKRRRTQEDKLKIALECLEEHRAELISDVDGDLSRLGSERLAMYYEIDRIIESLKKD